MLNELNMTAGVKLSWPGFTSATCDPSVAKKFATQGKDITGGGRYIFKIKGKFRGYDISSISGYSEKGNGTISIILFHSFIIF